MNNANSDALRDFVNLRVFKTIFRGRELTYNFSCAEYQEKKAVYIK